MGGDINTDDGPGGFHNSIAKHIAGITERRSNDREW